MYIRSALVLLSKLPPQFPFLRSEGESVVQRIERFGKEEHEREDLKLLARSVFIIVKNNSSHWFDDVPKPVKPVVKETTNSKPISKSISPTVAALDNLSTKQVMSTPAKSAAGNASKTNVSNNSSSSTPSNNNNKIVPNLSNSSQKRKADASSTAESLPPAKAPRSGAIEAARGPSSSVDSKRDSRPPVSSNSNERSKDSNREMIQSRPSQSAKQSREDQFTAVARGNAQDFRDLQRNPPKDSQRGNSRVDSKALSTASKDLPVSVVQQTKTDQQQRVVPLRDAGKIQPVSDSKTSRQNQPARSAQPARSQQESVVSSTSTKTFDQNRRYNDRHSGLSSFFFRFYIACDFIVYSDPIIEGESNNRGPSSTSQRPPLPSQPRQSVPAAHSQDHSKPARHSSNVDVSRPPPPPSIPPPHSSQSPNNWQDNNWRYQQPRDCELRRPDARYRSNNNNSSNSNRDEHNSRRQQY